MRFAAPSPRLVLLILPPFILFLPPPPLPSEDLSLSSNKRRGGGKPGIRIFFSPLGALLESPTRNPLAVLGDRGKQRGGSHRSGPFTAESSAGPGSRTECRRVPPARSCSSPGAGRLEWSHLENVFEMCDRAHENLFTFFASLLSKIAAGRAGTRGRFEAAPGAHRSHPGFPAAPRRDVAGGGPQLCPEIAMN